MIEPKLILKITILLLPLFLNSGNRYGINNYNFDKPRQIFLPSGLNEISGITKSADNKIFAINDEEGIVFKVDPYGGKILKKFYIGSWKIKDDFEGLAKAGKSIFAVSSSGKLYRFQEGGEDKAVEYKARQLPFSSNFEIEGLCYDKELNGLLIAVKDYSGKHFKEHRAIYLFSLNTYSVEKKPVIIISLKELKKSGIKDFFPSGIARHPASGNYFIVSAKGDNALVEIDRKGEILGTYKLDEKLHLQPEGITFLDDMTLIISDEAAGKKPALTAYSLNANK